MTEQSAASSALADPVGATASLADLRRASADLLGTSMHRSRSLSVEGALERLFTLAFRDLVYPQIWEDPRVDLAALELCSSHRMVTIASGGCNALSYLTAGPERIHALDLNAAHIALNRLKHVAVRHLDDHAGFRAMFAAADRPDNIDRYTRLIAPHLDAATRTYWEGRDAFGRRRIARFTNGFYRYGLLGRFISMAHVAARMRGVNPRGIMKAGTRAEQIAFFNTHLSPLFDSRMVRCVLSHRAALYGLGIPPAQYSALVGDAPHMAEVIRERLRKLACDFDLSDNYFAWQAFNRGYKADGTGPVPPYLEEANFAHLRERIDRLTVHLDNYTQFLSRQPAASLDRFVLLDAQDWMSDTDLTALWTEITRTARPGARVIFRTAGHETILPGRVPPAILDRWSYAAERSAALTRQDRSAIYGGFHLYCLGSAT